MARITAAEAAQIIQQEQRQLNQAILPPTLNRIRVLMQEETFPICNVGPWEHRLERAALHVFIPAYDPKTDTEKLGYAKSAPLPEIRREAKLIGGGGEGPLEYGWIEDDGRAVALDLIGVGFGMPAHNALIQYGVFVPKGKEATKEEIAAANRELDKYCDRLIGEARDAYDKGREEWGKVRSERHLWAGRRRGIQEKWVTDEHTQESVACRKCGTWNPSDIAQCKCGFIINAELYVELETEQAKILERITRPAKK